MNRKAWIANVMIALVAFVVLGGCSAPLLRSPDQEISTDTDLIVEIDTDVSVGSVYINYTNADGSDVTEGGMNADNSLLERGDNLQFDGVEWPVSVTVCSDLQGSEALAQTIIEEAPAEGWLWCVTLVDSSTGLKLVVTDTPRG